MCGAQQHIPQPLRQLPPPIAYALNAPLPLCLSTRHCYHPSAPLPPPSLYRCLAPAFPWMEAGSLAAAPHDALRQRQGRPSPSPGRPTAALANSPSPRHSTSSSGHLLAPSPRCPQAGGCPAALGRSAHAPRARSAVRQLQRPRRFTASAAAATCWSPGRVPSRSSHNLVQRAHHARRPI